ncbi:MAG: methyltransferase domain-containing protein [Candidatus Bathyarchaeota archaeon]|nr:methyltransferase domain-containing protein [Candidatus Bathyarchaeota archaeon]MDH5786925.1 methyltransferase domain-containing protein [Candidatus Bathyarchaeota archaeon]
MNDEFSLEARFYDETWGKYDYDADMKFLNDLFQKKGCKTIIDIGCGTGNHFIRLSKLGYEVTGVDISQAMLGIARKKKKEGKIRFIQGDMRRLGIILRGEKFDAAICLGMVFSNLEQYRHVQAFLSGLRQILRKNGLFIFNTRNAKKINEDLLNRLILERLLVKERLQLLLFFYNTRHPRNRNVIIWRPVYLMKENGKVDLQIREHKLRWHNFSILRRMLIESKFEVKATYSGNAIEEFNEEEHANMWFVTMAK